jgi:hypothetical protein
MRRRHARHPFNCSPWDALVSNHTIRTSIHPCFSIRTSVHLKKPVVTTESVLGRERVAEKRAPTHPTVPIVAQRLNGRAVGRQQQHKQKVQLCPVARITPTHYYFGVLLCNCVLWVRKKKLSVRTYSSRCFRCACSRQTRQAPVGCCQRRQESRLSPAPWSRTTILKPDGTTRGYSEVRFLLFLLFLIVQIQWFGNSVVDG